jgi:protein gp37
MADKSKIEWCDATISPLYGCTRVSPACQNCYAEKLAARFVRNPQVQHLYAGTVGTGGKWTGKLNLHPERMEEALRWKKPRRIFVASQADLFHEDVPDSFLDAVFAYMAFAPQHTFLLLTKRPERMRYYLTVHCKTSEPIINADGSKTFTVGVPLPLPNVWLGVTVEDQQRADERIPVLLDTPAAKRFVSMEPLLGPVYIGEYLSGNRWMQSGYPMDAPLDWVIAGGESGPNARPSHPDWFRSLRDQCSQTGVPFFFKQWGEWAFTGASNTHFMDSDGVLRAEAGAGDDGYGAWPCSRVGKNVAGHLLDGQEWRQVPEVGE